ncbi:hypothetical protein ACHWQZ_G013997 [Mnemiopsis leidyi]
MSIGIWHYQTLLGCITILMTCSTVFGNGGVMLVVLLTKTLRSPTFTLILCLALSDFLMGTLHLSFVSAKLQILFDNSKYKKIADLSEGTWCSVSACFVDLFNYITTATTTLISVERCIALYYPLHYKVLLDIPKTIKTVILTWIIAILITLHVPITMKGGYYVAMVAQCVPDFGDVMGTFIASRVRLVYYSTTFILIAAACVLTLRVVIKFTLANSSVWVIRKSKVIKKTVTLMLVVILSLITWFPHMLVYFLRTFCRDRIMLSDMGLLNLRVLVWYFCYLSAALNPFVYAFRLPKFQRVCTDLKAKHALVISRLNRKLQSTYKCKPQSSVRKNDLANSMDLPQIATNDSYFSSALNVPTMTKGKMTRSNSGEIVLTRLDAFNI